MLKIIQLANVYTTFDKKKRQKKASDYKIANEKQAKLDEKARENRASSDHFKYDISIFAGMSFRNCDTGKTRPVELRVSSNGLIRRGRQISSGIKDIFNGTIGLVANMKATYVKVTDADKVTSEKVTVQH